MFAWHEQDSLIVSDGDIVVDNETRGARFKRLAEGRTRQVLDGLRKLANLANKYSYDFDKADVETIFNAIQERVELARRRFEAEIQFQAKGKDTFRL